MNYLVLECFGGARNATVVTGENGNNNVFNTREAADFYDGTVIEL